LGLAAAAGAAAPLARVRRRKPVEGTWTKRRKLVHAFGLVTSYVPDARIWRLKPSKPVFFAGPLIQPEQGGHLTAILPFVWLYRKKYDAGKRRREKRKNLPKSFERLLPNWDRVRVRFRSNGKAATSPERMRSDPSTKCVNLRHLAAFSQTDQSPA